MSAVLVGQSCTKRESVVNRVIEIADQLPRSVAEWTLQGPDQLFDTTSIYDYIDGHAEVYLAYTMQRCLARRYSGPGSDIVLDIFEMASPADAFGVFTVDLDGEDVEIGQGSRFRYGWLSFWKGPFFVSIYADGEGPAVEEAVLDLGRSVGRVITDTGAPPPIVSALPQRGLDASTIRYLYHPQILSTHTMIPLDNPLGVAASSPAVLAHYESAGHGARVLVVEYPTLPEAEKALQWAAANVETGDTDPRQAGESKARFPARLDDRTLLIVLDADDQQFVDDLMTIESEDQP